MRPFCVCGRFAGHACFKEQSSGRPVRRKSANPEKKEGKAVPGSGRMPDLSSQLSAEAGTWPNL